MTQHPATSRKRITRTAAALLLALPAALLAAPVHAAGFASTVVYPRAAVSSDAYRTPPGRLSGVEARPLMAADRAPSSRIHARRDNQVRQVDHQQIANSARGYSVQSELQRLYAEDGRQMPQMAVPTSTYRQSAATGRSAARPAATQPEERSSGLLAGLFDFGRSRNSRRSSRISRPPVEPEPFRPPTYRQQQTRRQQPRQLRSAQTPQPQRLATSPAPGQQPAAQKMPSDSVIELKRITPERNLAGQGSDFFPEDSSAETAGSAQTPSQARVDEAIDGTVEFFPADPGAAAQAPSSERAALSAATTAKEQMQQLFKDQSQAQGDSFQMPIETKAEIIPQPAPAVASEVVTTRIAPLPADGPAEPAPFFADGERAINPDESMEVSALDGQTFDPSGADSKATAGLISDAQDAGSRMQRIAAREGVGLKGYCPVALRDQRRLADGRAAYVSYYQGKAYYFYSDIAKEKFDASPATYAPASGGEDLVMKSLTGEVMEGSLDHSVWYKGRLYLFHTAENLKTFMAAPGAMAVSQ